MNNAFYFIPSHSLFFVMSKPALGVLHPHFGNFVITFVTWLMKQSFIISTGGSSVFKKCFPGNEYPHQVGKGPWAFLTFIFYLFTFLCFLPFWLRHFWKVLLYDACEALYAPLVKLTPNFTKKSEIFKICLFWWIKKKMTSTFVFCSLTSGRLTNKSYRKMVIFFW